MDRHIAVWLHDGLVQKLTQAARWGMEREDLLLSPMSYLDFDYLYRRGRIRYPSAEIFTNLSTRRTKATR